MFSERYRLDVARESDSYFERNLGSALDSRWDPVMDSLVWLHAQRPVESILEIGSFDGSRLARAKRNLGCSVAGLEASGKAVSFARSHYPDIDCRQGIAPMDLEFWSGQTQFDVVIVGFFLYLLPRSLLFALASMVDSLVKDGGALVVYDFLSPHARLKEYGHNQAFQTFKFDYSLAWLWNPQYALVKRTVTSASSDQVHPSLDEIATVDVLRKLVVSDAYVSP